MFEVLLDHEADVLCVRGVEGGIDLVEDVEGRGLVEQQREDERESDERALTAAQLGERLLPDLTEADLELDTVQQRHGVRVLELGDGARQQRLEYVAKVLVDGLVGLDEHLGLDLLEVVDGALEGGAIIEHDELLLVELVVLLLLLGKHAHGAHVHLLGQLVLARLDLVEAMLDLFDVLAPEVVDAVVLAEELALLADPRMSAQQAVQLALRLVEQLDQVGLLVRVLFELQIERVLLLLELVRLGYLGLDVAARLLQLLAILLQLDH